jgi:Cu+-exporting ATPase
MKPMTKVTSVSTESISFPIRGMREACPKCAVEIERVLTQLDGVVAAQVNYATERARVVYDPARVTAPRMVSAIRSIAFDTPLEHQTLCSGDLLYASSARTVEKLLQQAEGVVHVSVDLAARKLALELFSEYGHVDPPVHFMGGLGLKMDQKGSADARSLFVFRSSILVVIELLALWSAGAHAGVLLSPSSLHAPLVPLLISLVALFGAGWPFYRLAFNAALQGEFDASVMVALVASLFALAGLPIAILSPARWLADIGFLLATTMTTGWFIARALSVWVFPHFARTTGDATCVSAARAPAGILSNGSRQ